MEEQARAALVRGMMSSHVVRTMSIVKRVVVKMGSLLLLNCTPGVAMYESRSSIGNST